MALSCTDDEMKKSQTLPDTFGILKTNGDEYLYNARNVLVLPYADRSTTASSHKRSKTNEGTKSNQQCLKCCGIDVLFVKGLARNLFLNLSKFKDLEALTTFPTKKFQLLLWIEQATVCCTLSPMSYQFTFDIPQSRIKATENKKQCKYN